MAQDGVRRGKAGPNTWHIWNIRKPTWSLMRLSALVWALRSLQSSMGLAAQCFYFVSPANCTSPAQHAKIQRLSTSPLPTTTKSCACKNATLDGCKAHWRGTFRKWWSLPSTACLRVSSNPSHQSHVLNLKQYLQHRLMNKNSLKWSCQSPRWYPACRHGLRSQT